MISKTFLPGSFNHDNIYEIPVNYEIPYVNKILVGCEKFYLSPKRNVEYACIQYIGDSTCIFLI